MEKETELDPNSPYPGLRPYTEEQQGSFFGRGDDRKILIDMILANRLTLLFAASGVGKSSLLRAAVLPHLTDPKHENLEAVYYSDWVTEPLPGLKQSVIESLQVSGHLDESININNLGEQTLTEFFQFITLFTSSPFVVILDQFEEFFQYHRYSPSLIPFISQLSDAIKDSDSSIAFVISMREDFALELNAFKDYFPTTLFEHYYRLERLTVKSARRAIIEPVKQIGFSYEPELVDALLKDLSSREQRRQDAMPLPEFIETVEPPYLQIVCSQLWNLNASSPTKTISLESYTASGRAAGLLESFVETFMQDFTSSEKRVASICFDHMASRRGTKIAYRIEDILNLAMLNKTILERILKRLESARILRSQSRDDGIWYELYHDLFTQSVDSWNQRYKSAQRSIRGMVIGTLLIAVVCSMYGAYDLGSNLTSYHLRISPNPKINDIDLYRGRADSNDLFNVGKYVAQTGFKKSQLEPDKNFHTKPVGDISLVDVEIIDMLPRQYRLTQLIEAGRFAGAKHLAEFYVLRYNAGNPADNTSALRTIEILGRDPSSLSLGFIESILSDTLTKPDGEAVKNDDVLKIAALKELQDFPNFHVEKIALALAEEEDNSPELRSEAITLLTETENASDQQLFLGLAGHQHKALSNSARKALTVENLLSVLHEDLNKKDMTKRRRAIDNLIRLKDPRAHKALIEHFQQEKDANLQVMIVKVCKPDECSHLLNAELSPKVLVSLLSRINTLDTALQFITHNNSLVRSQVIDIFAKKTDETNVDKAISLYPTIGKSDQKSLLETIRRHALPQAFEFYKQMLRSANETRDFVTVAKLLPELSKYQTQSTSGLVEQYLKHEDLAVRESAMTSGLAMKLPSAIELLMKRFQQESAPDQRYAFSLQLLRIDDPRALALAFQMLSIEDKHYRSKFTNIRQKITINSKEKINVAKDLLRSDDLLAIINFLAMILERNIDIEPELQPELVISVSRLVNKLGKVDENDEYFKKRVRINALVFLESKGEHSFFHS